MKLKARKVGGWALLAMLATAPLVAQDSEAAAGPTMDQLLDWTNILWTCVAAFLVFFMQAGFALVETGLTRAKNACNILTKNLMDFVIGSLSFWAIGAALMFGVTATGYFGTSGFFWDAAGSAAKDGTSEAFGWAFLIFQTVFCATAATIVSGAVAERTKFAAYLIYSALICAIVYPIFGCWAWNGLWSGGGWLEGDSFGFHDFAGSTVVHSIGGWAALAGAIVVGPRLGKYRDGRVHPIPGHSLPLAALGVFVLWLGWFGFNPGSTTSVTDGAFAKIAVVTNLAAAAGALGGLGTSWALFKKPDLSFALNGGLAGLVAITAGCDVLSPGWAVVTGLVGGILVVFSVLFFDKIKVDDPVGAVSVHGVCGAWGTLATGLFAANVNPWVQLLGIGVAFAWSFGVSLLIFLGIKYTIGMRVSEEEELRGLDVSEHGMEAYAGFAMISGREPASTGTIVLESASEPVRVGR